MEQPPSLTRVLRFLPLLAGFSLVSPPPALATVSEPDGTTLPQPSPASEISVVTSRGFPASADTLTGLFAARGETLDPSVDAHQTPGTFSPQCGFTGQIVLHGGGCKNALGWYNATAGGTTPPAANQIYTLVPADLTQAPPNGISCKDGDFCPLAVMNTDPNQVGQHTWVVYAWDAGVIRSNPNYAGGQVGFALIGNSGQCSQTKYSQAELNTISTQYGVPWVTTLIYQSTVDPSAYYIAYEDLPMPASSWTADGCDGDFNDFVFYVTGLDCEGGGLPCDTTMPGICANGTTECSNGGMTINCVSNTPARAEVCNGLDDDCDGIIDNPEAPNLCPTGEVCSQGVCVYPCTNSEFPCGPPTVCDTGDQLCKESACIGVTCDSGQICHRGVCVGGCEGVTCPPNQVCRIGTCVDPCSGISCDSSQVCENGACVSPCSCRACPSGQTCTTAGTCVDQGCDKVTCNPPATVCVKGACQDGCQGVVCPTGQSCSGGECSVPDGGMVIGPQPDAGAPLTGAAGHAGTGGAGIGGAGTGTAGKSGIETGGAAGGGTSGAHEGGVTTCKCDSAEGPGSGGLTLMLGALLLAALRRRAPAVARRR